MPRRWQYPSWSIIDREALTRPEVTTPDKWWQPFSEPVRQHAGKIAFAAVIASGVAAIDSDALTRPEVTSLDKWWQPLSEPVRVQKPNPIGVARTNFEEQEFDIYLIPEELAWFRPLGGIGVKKELRLSGPTSFPVPEVVAEDITLDKWYSPLTEPVLIKPRASDFPTHTNDTEGLTQPEVTSLDKWYVPFSEPVLVKEPINVSSGNIFTEEDLVAAEDITLDKWYQPFSEFLNTRARSGADLDASGLIYQGEPSDFDPTAEFMGWFVSLDEPTLPKLRVAEFLPWVVDVEALTQPETTSLDKWYSPFSEPVRTQPISHAALFASGLVYVGEPSDVEPLAEFLGWYKGLDEPVLPLVLPISNYPATFFENEVSELDPTAERLAWYVDLSTPTLPKVRVAEFPAFVTDADSLTRAETTTLDRWWRELSEPVRTQPISLAALISGEVRVDEPSDLDPVAEQLAWYRNLDLPTLPKPRVAEFPAFVIDVEALTLAEIITLDKWWTELSEPVRVKARFLEALQLHVITDVTFDIAEIITLDKWYMPLVEPVRLGDRLIVPFRLPASVGREYQVATLLVKGRISKEADQTHVSKEADQTHISKEADQTKDSERC